MRPLRVAMLAGIKRPITPATTVSRLRVIVDLATELIARGHAVTMYATEDSSLPGATIIGCSPKGINFLPVAENPLYQHLSYLTVMVERLISRQDQYDVIHNHMYPEFLPLLARRALSTPLLTTFHAQMTPETSAALSLMGDARIVAISEEAKRASGLDLPVVHNGIDTDVFVPDAIRKPEYLLAIGRMSSARNKDGSFVDPKGIGNAIAIAKKAGLPLKIAGNVEDPAFYDEIVAPHINDGVELVGGVSKEQSLSREEVVKLYQGAIAFLNPINWEEPFGLVMAEAMSCGLPVLAFNRGAVSELVVDGKTGFVIDHSKGIDGIVEALAHVGSLDRSATRSHAMEKFSKKRMATDYENLYASMTGTPL